MEHKLRNEILEHLRNVETAYNDLFPSSEFPKKQVLFIRNPFHCTQALFPVNDREYVKEFNRLKTDPTAIDLWREVFKNPSEFWPKQHIVKTYPLLAKMAFKLLLPFVSTYCCEAGFSAMKCIKTDKRTKLEVENDLVWQQ